MLAKNFALLVVGRDESGIIAALTKVLLQLECNLADTCMSVLNGEFTMMIIVQAPAAMTRDRLVQAMNEGAKDFSLAIFATELNGLPADEVSAAAEREHALVTVYGPDRAGIVQSVSAAIALTGSNITDLRTRREHAEKRDPFYTLFLEVELAPNVNKAQLRRLLEPTCKEFGVEIVVQDVAAMEL